MNKIVVSIVLAVLSLMVTIVSFIINDIASRQAPLKTEQQKVPSHGRIKSAHLPGYRAFPEMSGPG